MSSDYDKPIGPWRRRATPQNVHKIDAAELARWVLAADEPADPGEWLDTPFDDTDPQRVVCRFDVSAVFDDDLDQDDDSDDGAELIEDDDLEPLDADR